MGAYFDNGTRGVICHHNIFYGVKNYAICPNAGNSSNPRDVLIYNNLCVHCRTPVLMRSKGKTMLNNATDAGDSSFGHAGHNVTGLKESDFVDFAHFNFRPASASPVIHAGVPIPGVTDAMGKMPDCGPYEFGQAASEWWSGATIRAPLISD